MGAMRRWAGAGLMVLLALRTFGQDAALRFEVASIKPSGPQSVRGSEGGPGTHDPGMYLYSSATIEDLISFAYDVEFFQISSAISLDRDHFDVVVKIPPGSTKHQFELMLQNLLAERFQLRLHIQKREFPGYELVVAKTGTKLKEGTAGSPPNAGFPDLPPGQPGMAATHSMTGDYELVRIRAVHEPISELADLMGAHDMHVVDKTGLTGVYDFTLEYTLDAAGAAPDAPPAVPNLFTALQRELGLQLVPKKIPYDVLMIDHVERTPSDN